MRIVSIVFLAVLGLISAGANRETETAIFAAAMFLLIGTANTRKGE